MATNNDESSSKRTATYWEAIVSNRNHVNTLLSDGTSGHNLFEKMATRNINYRINEERNHRCPICWYCDARCVCDMMPNRIDRQELPNKVKILLLMHHKEYLNAGNSSKSLIALLPEDCVTMYVYGKEGDLDKCLDEMMVNQGRLTAILWPGESAISIGEFIRSLPSPNYWKSDDGKLNVGKEYRSAGGDAAASEVEEEGYDEILRIVALDGTYKNAKNMYKSISRRLGDGGRNIIATPPCIALHPKSVSQFHRAKKNYGAAIRDSLKNANETLDERALRVSTAEACALLLTELGAKESVQEKLTKALLVNNCDRITS